MQILCRLKFTARSGVYNIVTVNPDAVSIPYCILFVPCFFILSPYLLCQYDV